MPLIWVFYCLGNAQNVISVVCVFCLQAIAADTLRSWGKRCNCLNRQVTGYISTVRGTIRTCNGLVTKSQYKHISNYMLNQNVKICCCILERGWLPISDSDRLCQKWLAVLYVNRGSTLCSRTKNRPVKLPGTLRGRFSFRFKSKQTLCYTCQHGGMGRVGWGGLISNSSTILSLWWWGLYSH